MGGRGCKSCKGQAEPYLMNNIMEFLEDLGEIPETLKSKIMQEEKPDVLRRWLKLAAKAETIEQFEKSVEK